jgi:hypothetical protein
MFQSFWSEASKVTLEYIFIYLSYGDVILIDVSFYSFSQMNT